jgi:acetolactate synthase-1/2/3 large subunit
MYSTSTAFLEALQEAGVSYIFANLGSDHPAILEAMAEARATGKPLPRLITCPNEMVALTAAQGYAQISGKAQAVIVHVECGTQAMGGAIHNAAKSRSPVLIFAGASPVTLEGELTGSRNEFIHWLQDVFDQRGLVRGYMRYDNEIRTGANVKQVVQRAFQFANSDPKGPVYLMGTREVMEAEAPRQSADPAAFPPIAPGALTADAIDRVLRDLLAAKRPLIVTTYLGRNPDAVGALVAFAETLGAGVLESVPSVVNFPAEHPLYQGSQWNDPVQNEALAEADAVLVLDSDVPWITSVNRPAADAVIHLIDLDPIKQQMPIWAVPARQICRADTAVALGQLNAALASRPDATRRQKTASAHWRARHEARAAMLAAAETKRGAITVEYVMACLRGLVDQDTVLLNEAITNYGPVAAHLWNASVGGMFNSGGSSLGWNGGAAIGMKLAKPEKTVIAVTGDGSYMFSIPATVHWMARQYETPFLQVVLNNRGWKAPKLSMLAVHPSGHGSRANELGTSFDPPPDYAGIAAAAGGAYAEQVRDPDEVPAALRRGLDAVKKEKRAAVLDIWLEHL